MQNIILTIPIDQINFNDFNKLWSRENIISKRKINGKDFLVIKPYDWRYEFNDAIKSIYDIFTLGRTPIIWYEDAFKLINLEEETFLKTTFETSKQEYKISDIVDIYDEKLVLTNYEIANKNISVIKNFEKYNKRWFNAKYSLNQEGNEYLSRFGFKSSNELYTFNNTGDYWVNQTQSYNLLGVKKEFLNQLYFLTLIFSSIFIIIIILSSIISIFIISNLFIEQYKNIIKMFKVIGYYDFEIHLIFTKIIAPICFILITIGILTPQIIILIVRNILTNYGIFMPFSFMAIIFIVQVLFVFSMFFITYLITYKFVTNYRNVLITES